MAYFFNIWLLVHLIITLIYIHTLCANVVLISRAYLGGGGGFSGFNPPPKKKNAQFFLKSEGKELGRKRKKMKGMGGGLPVNIFLGVEIYFQWD